MNSDLPAPMRKSDQYWFYGIKVSLATLIMLTAYPLDAWRYLILTIGLMAYTIALRAK